MRGYFSSFGANEGKPYASEDLFLGVLFVREFAVSIAVTCDVVVCFYVVCSSFFRVGCGAWCEFWRSCALFCPSPSSSFGNLAALR